MRIREVWVRFYKSFNFDYELKATPGSRAKPWQQLEDGWMPHVRVPIEPDITATRRDGRGADTAPFPFSRPIDAGQPPGSGGGAGVVVMLWM